MQITYVGVWLAGVLSFFSPCIVPLIPMLVGFLAGDMDEEGASRKKLLINATGFFIGLMIVFVLLGAIATSIGGFLLGISDTLRKVFGILVIILGIFQLGIIKPNFLMRDRKVRVKLKKAKFGTAIIMGMAFSFGWTPCVGPILATVLLYAANGQTIGVGILLLLIYGLGFMIPFMIAVLLMSQVVLLLEKSGKYLHSIKWVSGILIIAVGIMIYFNYLNKITAFFS
jgi:cytochrome c-type biogenesis protein